MLFINNPEAITTIVASKRAQDGQTNSNTATTSQTTFYRRSPTPALAR